MACGCNAVSGYSGLFDEWTADYNYTTPVSYDVVDGFTAGEEWNHTGEWDNFGSGWEIADETGFMENWGGDYTGSVADSFNMDSYDYTQYEPDYDTYIAGITPDLTYDSLLGNTNISPDQYDQWIQGSTASGATFSSPSIASTAPTKGFFDTISSWLNVATTGVQTYKMATAPATTTVPRTATTRTGVPISSTGNVGVTANQSFPSPYKSPYQVTEINPITGQRIVRTVAAPVQVPMNEKTKAILVLGALAVVGILFLRKK